MSFALPLAIGAALLAVWVDYRFDKLRPPSLWRTAIHAAIAVAILQATTAGAHYVAGEGADTPRRLILVFGLLLPGLVYAFLTGLWLMRALSEVASTARR